MSPARFVGAAIAACAAALVLATLVFTDAPYLRLKVVQASVASADGRVRVTAPGSTDLESLQSPFAIIGRIRQPGSGANAFTVAIDGHSACTPRVEAGETRRFDCGAVHAWVPAANHVITIDGPSSSWSLEYLEIATHHGSAAGARYYIVLPAGSTRYEGPSAPRVGILSILIFVMLAFSIRHAIPRWVWWACAIGGAGLAVLLAALAATDRVTAFRVIFSIDTLTLWVIFLAIPYVWVADRWLCRRWETSRDRWVGVVRAVTIALVVCVVYGVFMRALVRDYYNGNVSGLLLIDQQRYDENPLLAPRPEIRETLFLRNDGGYDGQFMYFAAFDPFLRAFKSTPATYRQVMDAVPYRYGRIGYSLLTVLFSADRWERYPATMIGLIAGSLTLLAFLLAMMAQAQGLSPAWGLLVIMIPGFWQSAQTGLPEPIAAAALIAGVVCLGSARPIAAAIFFALTLLIRETGVIAVGCLLVATFLSGRRGDAIAVALFSFGVLFCWRLYIAWVLYPDWGRQALLYNPQAFAWPFEGVIHLWRIIARGEYFAGSFTFARAGYTYPVLLLFGSALAVTLAITQRTAVGIAAVAYAWLAIGLNYEAVWLHVSNAQRGTYELFVMLALSTLAIKTFSTPLRTTVITFWSCAAAYVFFLTFDAAYIRAVLAVPF